MNKLIITIICITIICNNLCGNSQSNLTTEYKTFLVFEFLNKYYSEFNDEENVVQNIQNYYSDTILKFHGFKLINKDEAKKRDISSFANNGILSFNIEVLLDNLKVTEYWDLDIANVKLNFIIEKTNNTLETFTTELRIALNKRTTKIIAIDKELHYYWDLRKKLNDLSKVEQSEIIGAEQLQIFNKNFGEIGEYTNGWKGDNDDPYFCTIRFDEGILSVAYNWRSYGFYPISIIDNKIIWYLNEDSTEDCVPPYCFGGFDNKQDQQIAAILEFDSNRNLKVLYYASFIKKLTYQDYKFPNFYQLQ